MTNQLNWAREYVAAVDKIYSSPHTVISRKDATYYLAKAIIADAEITTTTQPHIYPTKLNGLLEQLSPKDDEYETWKRNNT